MHTVITEEAAKAKAKALRVALAEKGVELNHQACLDVVAKVEGEKGWPALNAKQCRVRVSVPAPAPTQPLSKKGWKDRPAPAPKIVNIFEYNFEVVFRNPEGNRVNQEMFKSGEIARAAQFEWIRQGSGWCAEFTHFRWENGIAVCLDLDEDGAFMHEVLFSREDGSQFSTRFETATEARWEAKRWSKFPNPVVQGEYLEVESALRVASAAAQANNIPAEIHLKTF